MDSKTRIVILAAGKGTRMKSDLPKALMPLRGKPLIKHLLESVEALDIDPRPIIVVGYQKDLVMSELGDKYEYVFQEEQLGTGHALAQAEEKAKDAKYVIVLSSDQPEVKKETLLHCLDEHKNARVRITFASTQVPDFENWRKYFYTHGRILREGEKIKGIREFKNATDTEKEILEVNTGCVYVFDGEWVWRNLKKISNQNAQGEYLLTDLIEFAEAQGGAVKAIKIEPEEALGANSKEELEVLEKFVS